MRRDSELERALREIELPDEAQAQDRAWEVVRSAYVERAPIRPSPRFRRWAPLAAAGLVALGVGLSPAGAKVGDLVEEVVGIGVEDARPSLRSLPTAGELLVQSREGPWIVREDGSKRLLGDYEQATWSPHGRFLAVADDEQLLAVEPDGDVRWSIVAPGPVHDPRWSPSGFRIAYRAEGDLWVVAGDGTGKRLVASEIAPAAPAWRPVPDGKLAPGAAGSHLLTFNDEGGTVRTIDVDSGELLERTDADVRRLFTLPAGDSTGRALSPDGRRVAMVRRREGRSQLSLVPLGGRRQVLFSERSRLTGPTWSPDGEWLLVGLPRADQWLFIRTTSPGRVIAVDGISEDFDPGGGGPGRFPRATAWILPRR